MNPNSYNSVEGRLRTINQSQTHDERYKSGNHQMQMQEESGGFANSGQLATNKNTVSAADEAAGISIVERKLPTKPRPPRLSTFEKNGDRTYSLYSPRAEVQETHFLPRHLTSPTAPHLSTQEKNGSRTYSSYNPNNHDHDEAERVAHRIEMLRHMEPQAPRLATLEKYGERIYSSTHGTTHDTGAQYTFHRDTNHVTMPVAPRLVTLEKHGDRVYSSYTPHDHDYTIFDEEFENSKLKNLKRVKPRSPRLATFKKHGERLYSSYSNDSAPAALSEAYNYRTDSVPSSMRSNNMTIQSPFKLRSSSRSRARSASPYRSKLQAEEQSHAFKALPVPRSSYMSPRHADKQERKYTTPIPFNLRSEQRAASPARSHHSYHLDERKTHQFVARRMPNMAYKSPIHSRKKKHYTTPEPFHLHTNDRFSQRTSRSEPREYRGFIARPMPNFKQRPIMSQFEREYHPTVPVGYKLGYDRDRELNPIPDMSHKYPPKPPMRDRTSPQDFTFNYRTREDVSGWRGFPNDEMSLQTIDAYPYDDHYYLGEEVVHYIETPEGVNVDFDRYSVHSAPTLIEPHHESVQTQEEQDQYDVIEGKYTAMNKDSKVDSNEMDKEYHEHKYDEYGTHSDKVLEHKLMHEEHHEEECGKLMHEEHHEEECGIHVKSESISENLKEGSDSMTSKGSEPNLSSDLYVDGEVDEQNLSSSAQCRGEESLPEENCCELEHQEVDRNVLLASTFQTSEDEGGEKETMPQNQIQDEKSTLQKEEASVHQEEAQESNKHVSADLSSPTDDRSCDIPDEYLEDEQKDKKSTLQEDETFVQEAQELDNYTSADLSPLTDDVPCDTQDECLEKQQNDQSSSTDNLSLHEKSSLVLQENSDDMDQVIKVEEREEADSTHSGRQPVEDPESGHTSKFRQGWHWAPDVVDLISPETDSSVGTYSRASVEDPESGFTSSFRQGWHRTLEQHDLTTKNKQVEVETQVKDKLDDGDDQEAEETYYLPNVQPGKSNTKSRLFFNRNRNYSKMKKSKSSEEGSTQVIATNGNAGEEESLNTINYFFDNTELKNKSSNKEGSDNTDSKDSKDVVRKPSNHDDINTTPSLEEKMRSGSLIGMLKTSGSMELEQNNEQNWWCCESPIELVLKSNESRDDNDAH